jgi:outer membrane protein
MNLRHLPYRFLGALLLALVLPLALAQTPPNIVFVDTQAAINAHPAGEQANQLQQQARAEIDALNQDLQALVTRLNAGQQLSPEEQTRFNQLRTAITSVQERYAAQIQQVVQPALTAVNQVIREIAEENGYDIVMDSVIAGQEPQGINLVVYARPELDITPLVIERIRALGP